MEANDLYNYERIAEAIDFIRQHHTEQPDLETIAGAAHLSPFHFQRIFSEWAGVSPKKFLQFLTVEHAKDLLKRRDGTVFDAAVETGLSGTGRLHDLFMHIEGMTPGEYKNGGRALYIQYSFCDSPFGRILVASTAKGICHLSFADDKAAALIELRSHFPEATYAEARDSFQTAALSIFTMDWASPSQIKLHLKGTDFQLKVWNALLQVPLGSLTTYGEMAGAIRHPGAARAVGSAVGDNPVAFLIPCHRVIQSTGVFGQYHWGSTRKAAIIGWEGARTSISVN
jgi:AraC family transcriptional regulator, regulatory protein of adaptative response / methylated-DNA-[protein]-cysteine methyltransferase